MDKNETESWERYTEVSRYRWQVDQIHNGRNGRDLLIYKGGMEKGIYIEIMLDGLMVVGTYTGARPHISNAIFNIEGKKQFKSMKMAVKAMMEANGVRFILDIIGCR